MSPIIQILVGENPGRYILQRGGEEKVFRCPQCGKQKYYVNERKGMAHCFVCSWSKRIPRMMNRLKRTFEKRVEVEEVAIEIPEYAPFTEGNFTQNFYDFFKRRNMLYQKGWGASSNPKLRGRLIIPIKENGKTVSWVARAVNDEKPKELSGPNRSNFLYGYDDIAHYGQRSQVILVEGIFDAEALKRHGFYALAIMGSYLSDVQLGKLLKLNPLGVTIMMDGDEAGWRASLKIRNKLQKRFDPFRIRMATLPAGRDPDELSLVEVQKNLEGDSVIISKWFCGIDNGVTGSVGLLSDDGMAIYFSMPVRKELNYTKKKQWLNRVDGARLTNLLHDVAPEIQMCLIERPMINPGRWIATMSAVRAMEATLIVLELLKIPYQFIDSKEWQKAMLPSGLEKEELKEASYQVGKRLHPKMDWSMRKDADGILMAHYCKKRQP